VLLDFLVFWGVFVLCVFTFRVSCCDDRYDFRIKRYSILLYPQLFVGGTCLIYVICACLRTLVSNPYCVVFLF
jgi:hypothetical protein